MSSLNESGVYYTPSVGFPTQEIQHPGYPQDLLKQCSVKGCADTLSSSDPNRMCEGCRSRHRIYASTKRAKRKLEKAAITNAVAARSGKDIQEMSLVEQAAQPITWVTTDGRSHQIGYPLQLLKDIIQDHQPSAIASSSSLSSLSTWNHAIDPRLFSGDVSPASSHHLSPRPHQTSTSSELANALIPRQPTSVPISSSAVLPNQIPIDYSKHYRDHTMTQQQTSHLQISPQPHMSVASRRGSDSSNDNEEEQQVIASLQDMGELSTLSSNDRQTSSEIAELGQASGKVDGSERFCSVKGCKAVIQVSYEYKMCPPCRTRYRTYGNTKRAKWKAERDAFDREMASLRIVEDEKRKAKGFKPLAESPEELRAWELSIIDEQVPLVPVNKSATPPRASPVAEPGSAQFLPPNTALSPGMNSPMVVAGVYPPSIASSSTVDSPHAIPPYQHLNKNPLLAAAANTSLPARMCTVSHCHKILPGYYRYKRCEQHRLQNRHHSQLKRVREKDVKAVRPEEGATLVEIPPEIEGGGRAEKPETKQAKAALEGKEAGVSDVVMTGGAIDSESKKDKSHDQKRSKFSCSVGDCHNLLLPTVRWRSCEPCRSIDRRRKNQIRFEQKAAAKKHWSEKMDVSSQASANQPADGGNGKAQESQHAVSIVAVDPDAEGDIDMVENGDETEPKAVESQQTALPPLANPPPSIPTTSMTSGFSRFHVTIDPENASQSAALDPTTSTAKLVTLDDPLAFRAYRPKTTPSAIGRILARNPGLSVDAFTEVLQAEGASTGVMTLPPKKQASLTSITKPIITPTIPTSAPFVYKAPEKKNVSTRSQTGKGKRKAAASLEKQPITSSTPTPALGVSDSPASALPGSYGAYGYPQYPYPYPYYMPSPYGIPPFPYPQAPAPIASDSRQKLSSKSSKSATASSSSPTHIPPSTTIPGYPPYPYPYPPQPYGYPPPPGGYPYMSTRYIPGQQPFNGLPPGPSGSTPYPYPYYPPLSAPSPVPTSTFAPTPTLAPTSASAPFPKTAVAAHERYQQTHDTKFNYYHYGAGSSSSPTRPNDKRKRRKVDPDLEKLKSPLAVDQTRRDIPSSVPTPPPASVASGSSNVASSPVVSAQPETTDLAVDAEVLSKPNTSTRLCANKTCRRSLAVDTANTLCDKCRLRFMKHQVKVKKRFKLVPSKFLLAGKANMSGKQEEGSAEERLGSTSKGLDE